MGKHENNRRKTLDRPNGRQEVTAGAACVIMRKKVESFLTVCTGKKQRRLLKSKVLNTTHIYTIYTSACSSSLPLTVPLFLPSFSLLVYHFGIALAANNRKPKSGSNRYNP